MDKSNTRRSKSEGTTLMMSKEAKGKLLAWQIGQA